MGDFDKKPIQEIEETPRFKKLLALYDSAPLWDISTGKNYTRGQFKPLYAGWNESVCDLFQVIGTNELVYHKFLRRTSDGMKCSLMKKSS